MRTAGVAVVLIVSAASTALGEFEEARPSERLHLAAATAPSGGALPSVRSRVGPDLGAGAATPDAKIAEQIARYRALALQLDESSVDPPIRVESKRNSWSIKGEVYTIIGQPFEVVRDELGSPGVWCMVLPLHFNVKSCRHEHSAGQDKLTLYIGRKFYQPIDETRVLELEFEAAPAVRGFLDVRLRAETGPLGTKDYALSLFAIPLDADRSLIHFRFSHGYGLTSRMAMYGYLLTFGRKKVGFSVVDEDDDGTPVYVRGPLGMIERNAARYHLAIQAYLETLELAPSLRFESRLSRWYELTDAYPEQLHEMEKAAYLGNKRRERADQAVLESQPLIAVGP